MILDYVKSSIKNKWNEIDGHPKYLDGESAVNYIFSPVEVDAYKFVLDMLKVSVPDELSDLYEACNGFRLFLSSISIFGIQTGEEDIEPYDLSIENHNIHARMAENKCDNEKWFFFGGYGKDYVFAMDRSGTGKIVLVKNGFDKIIKEFESIEELVKYFLPRIIAHYDNEYVCDVPKDKYKDYPALANALYDLSAVGLE